MQSLVNGDTFHGSQLHLLTLPQNNTVEKMGRKIHPLGPAFGHTGLCGNLGTIPAEQLSPKWQSKFTFSAKKRWHSSRSGLMPEPPTTRASNCGVLVFVELMLQWFEQKSYLNRDNTCLELSTPAKFGSKHKMENIVFIGSAAIWSVAAAEHHVMGEKMSIYTETETRPTSHVKPEEDQGRGCGSFKHLPL